MFLKKKIQASSIAEVVIAVSIIALCIGIASLTFVRSTRSTMNFQDVRRQTEIQSQLWRQLYLLEDEVEEPEGVKLETTEDENDSMMVLTFIGNDEKVIWQQHWWKNE